jgi:uncharacterized protein YigA (DUF484 family)
MDSTKSPQTCVCNNLFDLVERQVKQLKEKNKELAKKDQDLEENKQAIQV